MQAAKYVAVAMAYDDVIRVADLKVRASRFERVRKEVGAKDDQIVYMTEYMHPRMEEVCGTLPKGLGLWIENRPKLFARLDRIVNKGRRVQTGTLFWFLGLYVVSALRRTRRGTLRHMREMEHREAWLAAATDLLRVELRPRRRGAQQPPAGQRLFRHPCARPVEVRPRDVGAADAARPRRWRRLDEAAAAGGAAG